MHTKIKLKIVYLFLLFKEKQKLVIQPELSLPSKNERFDDTFDERINCFIFNLYLK